MSVRNPARSPLRAAHTETVEVADQRPLDAASSNEENVVRMRTGRGVPDEAPLPSHAAITSLREQLLGIELRALEHQLKAEGVVVKDDAPGPRRSKKDKIVARLRRG